MRAAPASHASATALAATAAHVLAPMLLAVPSCVSLAAGACGFLLLTAGRSLIRNGSLCRGGSRNQQAQGHWKCENPFCVHGRVTPLVERSPNGGPCGHPFWLTHLTDIESSARSPALYGAIPVPRSGFG